MNTDNMLDAITRVQSGQVTYAVRDTTIDDLEIKAGQFIGIRNSNIVAANEDLITTSKICWVKCWSPAMKS